MSQNRPADGVRKIEILRKGRRDFIDAMFDGDRAKQKEFVAIIRHAMDEPAIIKEDFSDDHVYMIASLACSAIAERLAEVIIRNSAEAN